MVKAPEVQYLTIHGHKRAFVKAGNGPALLLLHGLGCDHTTWNPVIAALARRYTVIAPDLLGHGLSDKPRADYSVGGYANGMRDLLTVLGIDRVTVVGHSLGGGVAMQFAYQFPERTERMILVAPGGMGPEVTRAIRSITLPGFSAAMGVVTLPGLRHLTTAYLRLLAATGIYGVVSHAAQQRMREFGIRLALGAESRSVLGLVFRQGLLLAVIGASLGLAGALAMGGLLRAQLFGIEPSDPATLAAVCAALIAVALLACYLPAKRAVKINPASILRREG